jgi:hypothetical protein
MLALVGTVMLRSASGKVLLRETVTGFSALTRPDQARVHPRRAASFFDHADGQVARILLGHGTR